MEEPGFTVVLVEAGGRRAEVIQVLRGLTGLSAWRSSRLLESLPCEITGPTWLEAALDAVARLREAGADAVLGCDRCERAIRHADIPVAPQPCASPCWRPTDCRASHPGP
jgi:hypothetical protein